MPWKTILTVACLAAFLAVPDLLPAYKNYKVVDWAGISRVFDFTARTAPASIEEEQQRLRPDAGLVAARSSQSIIGGLDHFYESLAQLESGQRSQVRVLHYGDSPVTADMITADMRSFLQKRFGDAGYGYHLIVKPWDWYEHRGVTATGDGWQIDPVNQSSIHDGLFGLGGVSFRGQPGAVSQFRFRDASPMKVEVDYLPGGGRVAVLAEGESIAELDTASGDGHAMAASPVPVRRLALRVEAGSVRLFGVFLSRDTPGVIYSSLGLNGGYISVLAKMFDGAHWEAELRHFSPDLVVVNYGTNESVHDLFVDTAFEKELREAIRRIRKAVPDASVLVMSPMDRGRRDSNGEIGTVPALHRVVTIEQKVASELNVGFFNTFEAMGGPGTMGRWYAAEPRLVNADFIHPMPSGAKIVATLFYKALMGGYQRYKTAAMRERYGVHAR